MASPSSAKGDEVQAKLNFMSTAVLNLLRKNNQLCDVVLKVDGGSFNVHRAVLSSVSPYFRALFTADFEELNCSEVALVDVQYDVMATLVEYAYTLQCRHITDMNVCALLHTANRFLVESLVRACCQYMMLRLTPANCISVREVANAYCCDELATRTSEYMMNHFEEMVAQSPEFRRLPLDSLKELLSRDELNVSSEEKVFEAVVAWIDVSPSQRRQHIVDLLACIRLGMLSNHYVVERVKAHPYVRDSEECRPIVRETLKFLYDFQNSDLRNYDGKYCIARPRLPRQLMFALGGWSGGSATSMVEVYDNRTDKWTIVTSADPTPRAYHGCVVLNSRIFVIGGFDGMEHFNSVKCFDPLTKSWSEISPMNHRRCYVSATTLDGCLYAMGGYDGHVRQSSAERYTPHNNLWTNIASMHEQRSDAKATSLNGLVYIAGGFNGQECLSSAEYYNPVVNQWTVVAHMRSKRSGVGLIAYSGHVYAVGGFDGTHRLFSAERYEPELNKWQPVASMCSSRSNFAIEVIDNLLFVIGGYIDTTTISSVECYDVLTNKWLMKSDMNLNRSALCACVLSALPNIRDYIHRDNSTKTCSATPKP